MLGNRAQPMKKAGTKKTRVAKQQKPARKKSPTKHAKHSRAGAAPKKKDLLANYREKRDFKKTSEPQGKRAGKRKKTAPIFVVQQHAASHLHYDFRLEIAGVLKSWAVPKGPPIDPADKRLAVETEDHPLDYAGFEGVIPEGEYGGGTVIVWDTGPIENLKRDEHGGEISLERSYAMGTIEIRLEGRKLRGGYALVHSKLGGNAKNWLLIKMKDHTPERRQRPFVAPDASVISGRTLRQVAEEESAGS
jgi:DNA ligase D-like protein (predicted 3'-phosphoesterase)